MGITIKKLAQTTIPTSANIFSQVNATGGLATLKLSSSVVVQIFATDSTGMARVGTINVDNSITFGNNQTFNTSSATHISACAVDSSRIFISFRDTGNSNYGTGIVGSISGSTITWGSKVVFNTSTTGYMDCELLTTDKVLISFVDGSDDGNVIIASLSGTTISSYGAVTTFDTGTINVPIAASILSATSFAMAYEDANDTYVVACSVSGTTITSGTPTLVKSATNLSTYKSIDLAFIDSTHALCTYAMSTGAIYARVITISGTSISSINTEYSIGSGYAGASFLDLGRISSSEFVLSYAYDGSTSKTATLTISNTIEITAGVLRSFSSVLSNRSLCVLDSSTYLIAYRITSIGEIVSFFTIDGNIIIPSNVTETIVTGATGGHTEISSIYLFNPNEASVIVTFYDSGNTSSAYLYPITVTANSGEKLLLPNSPIIIDDGDTLRASQTGALDVTITCYGLEETT